jgi:hypothetical protein
MSWIRILANSGRPFMPRVSIEYTTGRQIEIQMDDECTTKHIKAQQSKAI